VSYGDYPSVAKLFVVVGLYYGDRLKVNPKLLRGSLLVDFTLDTLPVRSDRTVDCFRLGVDYKLVTLVAIIFSVFHKVMVKGSLTVPRKDVGQTHSGSLEGKSTITAWKLAPRCKSIKKVANVADTPALSMSLPILISQHWISSPTSGFIVGRFL
jgi:hypothetical protein